MSAWQHLADGRRCGSGRMPLLCKVYMKTAILCLLTAILTSGITGFTVYNRTLSHSTEIHEREYNQQLQKVFEFADGFTFQVEDVRIKVFGKNRPSTRIIGIGSRPDIPMAVDLIDETGESIFSGGACLTSFVDHGKYHFGTHISYWTKSPELKLVATIFPHNAIKRQSITQTIPNPIHFHRLIDLGVGAESANGSLKAIGSRSSAPRRFPAEQ